MVMMMMMTTMTRRMKMKTTAMKETWKSIMAFVSQIRQSQEEQRRKPFQSFVPPDGVQGWKPYLP